MVAPDHMQWCQEDRVSSDPEHFPRVLVVAEKPLVADVVTLTLKHAEFVTRTARDLGEAFSVLDEWQPHLAVVDLDRDGFGEKVVRRIVDGGHPGPKRVAILALTRRGDLKANLAAFDRGVDDMMTTPISPDELLARVLALTRRSLGTDPAVTPVLRIGELEIDILNRRLRAGTSEIPLSSLELCLLYLLAANPGQIVTDGDIRETLLGVDFVLTSRAVRRHIRTLRAHLLDGGQNPSYIAIAPGQGYRLQPVVEQNLPMS
jgi:DNA-binding response OmpR family regulator